MPQYAVALILPEAVERELERLRGNYASRLAYITIPHITLIYPFEFGDGRLLENRLEETAQNTKPFGVMLEGVQYFEEPDRVAFIAVKDCGATAHLRENILKALVDVIKKETGGELDYRPHVTIGANIPVEIFRQVQEYLSRYHPRFEITIDSFALLSNKSGLWAAERVFYLTRERGS